MTDDRSAARVMADECLCFRARRVSRALTRMYDEALRPLGIQATQLTVLNVIAVKSEDGECGDGDERGASMSELAEILAMDGSTLSRNVRPLEKSGLVRIARSPVDRRVRLVSLTPEGRRTVAEALPRWTRAHERVVAALGSEAAAALREHFDVAVAAAADPSDRHGE